MKRSTVLLVLAMLIVGTLSSCILVARDNPSHPSHPRHPARAGDTLAPAHHHH